MAADAENLRESISPGFHAALIRQVDDLAEDRIARNAEIKRLREALREIGTPKSVPEHFDPLDWWRHTACKRGEIARDALGVTAEELIRDRWENAVNG